MQGEVLFWGLKLSDLINIAAILVGPITAVGITLFIEGRRRERETKVLLVRMIMDTRHLPADSRYNTAINLIPVEFNHNEPVMSAWKKYIDHVRYQPSEANKSEHDQQTKSKQTKLIYQLMKTMGFSLSETDIEASPYFSEGAAFRDNLYLTSLEHLTFN